MFRAAALSFALLVPNLSFAQCAADGIENLLSLQQRADLHRQVADTPYGSGLYWTANKGDTELVILGTMHLPDPRHTALMDMAFADLQAADILLVEATLEDQTAMQVHMAQNPDLITITDGPSLIDLLDDDTWALISDAAADRSIPGVMAAKMQPWFLAMTLAIPPCAASSMMSGEMGLDGMLMMAAAMQDVPVAPLEPWQNMLNLLSSGTFDEQIDALKIGLVEPDIQDALMATLTASYFAGETAYGWHVNNYLIDFLPDMDPAVFEDQMAELEAELLNERNRNWIPVIDGYAQDHDDIFIAFGAAHLIGEQGVLNLLAQNGWAVAQR